MNTYIRVGSCTDFLADPFSAVTVFAPTDAAIQAVANKMNMSLNDLLGNPQLLVILLYHLVQEPILVTTIIPNSVQTKSIAIYIT